MHAFAAIIISICTLSPTAGVAAYWMREYRDFEKPQRGPKRTFKDFPIGFDWRGFLWPTFVVGPFALAEIALKVYLLWG